MSSSKNDCENLQKRRVPLSEAMISELHGHMQRTGVGAEKLLTNVKNRPNGITVPILHSWLRGGVATVRKDFFDFVLARWQELADANVVILTPELVAIMRNEQERTGTGAGALLRGVRPSDHDGLCSALVKGWMSGKTRSADKPKFDFVLARWKALPNYDDQWMTITAQQRAFLKAEMLRIQISQRCFFDECRDLPEGLTIGMFGAILAGGTKSIRKSHYSYLVDTLAGISNEELAGGIKATRLRKGHTVLTDDMREALKAERVRTGVTAKSLAVIVVASGGGKELKPETINGWINGRNRMVPKVLFENVLAEWRSLPDKNAFWDKFDNELDHRF